MANFTECKVARAMCIENRAYIVNLSNHQSKRFDFAVQIYGVETVMEDITAAFHGTCTTPRPNGEYSQEHFSLYCAVVAVAMCSAKWALDSRYNVGNDLRA